MDLEILDKLNSEALERSKSAIIVSDANDPDCPIIYINRSFATLTGYGEDEVLGKNCRFLQGEDRDQPARKTLREALEKKQAVNGFLRNYRKDGSPFYNELFIDVISDEAGQVTHYFGCQNEVQDFERIYVLESAHKGYADLNAWEKELFKTVVLGKTDNSIAAKFQVSAKEAAKMRNDLMQKFDVKELTMLVRYAIALGIPFNQ